MKRRGYVRPLEGFKSIHMPSNTGAGVILAALSTVFGFAMIWYMWWLAILSFAGLLVVAIGHTFNYKRDFDFPKDQVVQAESERTRRLALEA
jgi:cytochrome o ubiquinol oxidase subunit 1